MGPLLRPHTLQLAGVDLSQGMVAKAQDRACYDELVVDELVHYLTAAAAAVQQHGTCCKCLLHLCGSLYHSCACAVLGAGAMGAMQRTPCDMRTAG
jgi:hypothetical protein